MLLAGAWQAQGAPGEKDHMGRSPGRGVASLFYCREYLPTASLWEQEGPGEAPHSCVWSYLSYNRTGKHFSSLLWLNDLSLLQKSFSRADPTLQLQHALAPVQEWGGVPSGLALADN